MQLDSGERESHTPRGAIDVAKLDAFRDAFVSIEPVSSGTIDDRVDPRELRLTIPYGVGDAAETKFTVRWTAVGGLQRSLLRYVRPQSSLGYPSA